MPRKWFSTAEACKELGVCSRTLLRMRDRGQLLKGLHWKVVNPSAARLTYLYNVAEIDVMQSAVQTEVPINKPLEGIQPALINDVLPYELSNGS
jgi:hypothetical protein